MLSTKTLSIGLLVLALGGCYHSHQVRPTELPKLARTQSGSYFGLAYAGSAFIPVGGRMTTSVKVVTADGGVATVSDDATVKVESDGLEYVFTPPLLPEIADDTLVMRDRLGEERFSLAEVDAVTVEELDSTATWLGVGAVSGFVGALVVLFAVP